MAFEHDNVRVWCIGAPLTRSTALGSSVLIFYRANGQNAVVGTCVLRAFDINMNTASRDMAT